MRKLVTSAGAPRAIGPYSQAIDTGGLVFCAGQIGLDPETGTVPEGIEAQAERAMKNVAAVLDAAGLSWADVVKSTCFLAEISDFDAFNAVYKTFLSDPPPARSTFAVKELPRGARVEVEAIAVRS
jgi:2-iminobutanoate/2-iminopropanoate deaminase